MEEQLENEAQQPAIKALGSLFKLTQVFLWDDAFVAPQNENYSSTAAPYMDSAPTAQFSSSSDDDSVLVVEDMELTQQMNSLGLPVSFKTNKRGNRTKQAKAKRKTIKLKPNSDHLENKDDIVQSGEVFNCRCSSNEYSACMCTTENRVDRDPLPCDLMSNSDMEKVLCPSGGNGEAPPQNALPEGFLDNQLVMNAKLEGSIVVNYGDAVPEKVCEDITAAAESGVSSAVTDHLLNDEDDTHHGDYGDWRQFWDDFYMRNYFYNIKTHESTWELPPEFEYVSFTEGGPKPRDEIADANETDIFSDTASVVVLDPCQDESYREKSSRIEPIATNLITGLTDFSEINTNSVGHAPVYTASSAEEHVNDQLSNGEDWGHSKSDEVDVNSTNQVSGAASLITTITDVSEESLDAIQLEVEDELGQQNPSLGKKKKKVRKTRRQRKLFDYIREHQFDVIPQEFPDGIVKYWCQRYSLFSLYDDGIKMDEEGWFSVTPEPIARHHAMRCGDGIVIDSFTGVGGNAIQLAKRGNHVIAVDVDPQKIEFAQHNAAIYGVNGQIDFITGDFFQLAPEMKADTVFLSPPWGGPDYLKVETYNINTMLKPHDGNFLFNTSRRIASRIIMFLPRNVDVNQLAELSLSAEPPWMLEVEKNFLNGKLKAITAYFSSTENVERGA